MLKLYGITNCDSVKKARKQLDADGVNYEFIDLKSAQLSADMLTDWLNQCPNTLVNKRSTTYRQIKADWLAAEGNITAQIALIQANPTVIKRPVIVSDDGVVSVGMNMALFK